MFTKISYILAWLICTLGVLRVFMGLVGALSEAPTEFAASILRTPTTGAAIDQGLYAIVAGVVLGMFVEISKALQRNS